MSLWQGYKTWLSENYSHPCWDSEKCINGKTKMQMSVLSFSWAKSLFPFMINTCNQHWGLKHQRYFWRNSHRSVADVPIITYPNFACVAQITKIFDELYAYWSNICLTNWPCDLKKLDWLDFCKAVLKRFLVHSHGSIYKSFVLPYYVWEVYCKKEIVDGSDSHVVFVVKFI